jgi:hypothetical protein
MMALRRVCPVCNGSGGFYCGNKGVLLIGTQEDILGLVYAHEIYDLCDPEDIENLGGQQTEEFNRVLSMGALSLYQGKRARATLESLFPIGTVTRTNLDALIAQMEQPVEPPPE